VADLPPAKTYFITVSTPGRVAGASIDATLTKGCETMNLPDKPSELIRLALADLALCAADPNYAIDMGQWHMPDHGVCQVCLAGAVMAKSLNASRAAELYPEDFPENRQKIKSLDDFRDGRVCSALAYLGHDLSNWGHGARDREITPYRTDPGAFMADMRKLADDLEAAGY